MIEHLRFAGEAFTRDGDLQTHGYVVAAHHGSNYDPGPPFACLLTIMDLGQFIVLIIVLGLVWWVLTTYVPMPPAGKTALTIAFVVVVILGLLSFLGIGLSLLHYHPQLMH